MEYLKQFQHHIANNDLPSIVNLWQEYCLSDEIDPEELKQILLEIKLSSLRESFGCYVEQILLLWEALPEGKDRHEILKLIFDLETTNEKALGDLAYEYLENRYKNDKHFQQKIKLVGLRERISFQHAISNYELLTHMEVGNFFVHTGGWGVGEVTDVSMLREQITLEFDYVAGHKELSFANAFNTLVPISKDHFLARRFGSPEEFEEFAKSKPVETIRIMLRDLGPRTAAEIKDELADLVIPEEDWTRWWQTTRTKLKKDTMIETPTALKDPFRLRKQEVTHEERLQKALSSKPTPDIMIEMIYSFIRDFPAALKSEEFKNLLKSQLMEVLSHQEIDNSQEIQILFILQDLGHEKAKDLESVVSRFTDVQKIVNKIHVLAYKKRLLGDIKAIRGDWDTIFADLILTIDQNLLRDYLFEELFKSEKNALIEKKIAEMIEMPNISPGALLWYIQKSMAVEGKYPLSDQEGRNKLFEAFFVLLHMIEPHPKYRDLVKKMHSFLSSGRFANVRRIFQGANIEVVKEILLLCTKCQTLSDHDIKTFYSLAEVVHPSISSLRNKALEEEEEEEVIWTTQEGYAKINERIEHIATVETVDNAKEIETARSHGDLRENSEFKFAQERRARLQSELRFLSGQRKHMRVLTENDIDTSCVGIGTKVELEKENHEKIVYVLLGPWDADPENRVLSFQSKLAKSMIGLTVGSTCTILGEEWKVVSITSAIANS
jgi:transcription elongation factor GreA-like protein/transcription elongation GreA/GreB family factor